jgi:polysaccharide deacetylase 2 family uncharacterized protein YibQ
MNRKLSQAYILCGVIVGLLLIILFLLPGTIKKTTIREKEQQEKIPENGYPDTIEADREPVGKVKPQLYFIIDDVGYSLTELKPFLKFPGPITFAILPGTPYAKEAAQLIRQSGKDIIIHQPMEPVGNENPGPGTIYTSMSSEEIKKILLENIKEIPHAKGMNNHMGSCATGDPEVMKVVFDVLKNRKMFFLDSMTTPNSMGLEIAQGINLPYTKRNTMFLDNEKTRESILEAIMEGGKTARKKGHAFMIGHVTTSELAELLLELYPTFIEDGYTIKELSEYFLGGEAYEDSRN